MESPYVVYYNEMVSFTFDFFLLHPVKCAYAIFRALADSLNRILCP